MHSDSSCSHACRRHERFSRASTSSALVLAKASRSPLHLSTSALSSCMLSSDRCLILSISSLVSACDFTSSLSFPPSCWISPLASASFASSVCLTFIIASSFFFVSSPALCVSSLECFVASSSRFSVTISAVTVSSCLPRLTRDCFRVAMLLLASLSALSLSSQARRAEESWEAAFIRSIWILRIFFFILRISSFVLFSLSCLTCSTFSPSIFASSSLALLLPSADVTLSCRLCTSSSSPFTCVTRCSFAPATIASCWFSSSQVVVEDSNFFFHSLPICSALSSSESSVCRTWFSSFCTSMRDDRSFATSCFSAAAFCSAPLS
mmetsp:Transcript_44108/g.139176  ORF Transcript_44108/g.139176 Transcript_44108/m.139176 type:complete len:323 (-) Transcript_44108:2124-3092(-)